jgi:hypothetical protein
VVISSLAGILIFGDMVPSVNNISGGDAQAEIDYRDQLILLFNPYFDLSAGADEIVSLDCKFD